ncbi:MAG TPA: ATP-binding cassette domain-containing protein [Rhizomicrobium sp.]
MIDIANLTKDYHADGAPAVRGLDLAIATGEFLVLVGPSGCGKTTMLTMINRLTEPSAGEVRIDGRSIRDGDPAALRRRIGFVFQDVGLFPHLTAAENIGITLKLMRMPKPAIEARTDELMAQMQMPRAQFGGRFPRELSGGQRQRIGLARALAARPSIMLMDEPFGALDPLTRDELAPEYRALHDALGLTTVLVTHDMTEAFLLADRIAVMRAGRFVQIGTPQEIVSGPADDFVRGLIENPRKRARALARVLGADPT